MHWSVSLVCFLYWSASLVCFYALECFAWSIFASQWFTCSLVQGADEFPWKNKALALEHWLRNAEPPGCNA
jgi:hypothetical protein